jgi:ADP-heptose:LPS heptosyltransferase
VEDLRIGRLEPAFDDVRRIAVLRGGGLGDLLFAVPAMRSLADAYPGAQLVLLGTPGHADLLADRPGPVGDVMVLPVARGVYEPDGAADGQAGQAGQERFFTAARERRFDLAVQLHGGGRWSNPFLTRLGARYRIGCRTPDAAPLDRWLPYRYYQHEVLRALEIVGLAGARPTALHPGIEVTDADLKLGAAALEGLPRPVLTVHPGASDVRRRWPPGRFADIIARVAGAGAGVAVIGTAGERDLVDRVAATARDALPPGQRDAVRALGGALSLSGLVGVLATSAAVLANDSGPRHLAQAVGTPTVGLYWMGNVITAGPHDRSRNRVHVSWTPACPVCGASYTDPAVPRCAHDESVLGDVVPAEVLADIEEFLALT